MRNIYLKKLILSVVVFFMVMYFAGYGLKLIPEYSENKNLIHGCFKLTFLFVIVYFIRKESFFNWEYFFKNKILSVIVCALLIYGAISTTFNQMIQQKIAVSDYDHYSYLFVSMSTGFLEEFLFRILIFGYICKALESTSRTNHYFEVIVTGSLFAFLHFYNALYINSTYDFLGIVNQVLLATSVGIFLQSLFYRLNNIILNSIIHGILNYSGTRNTKLFGIERPADNLSIQQELLQSFAVTGLLITVLVIPVLILCVRNRENKMIRYESETSAIVN